MPIGSSLGITLPTQGSNSGTWGTDLNTELNKVITAIEAQVPASAIDFSANFDLNGYGLVDVDHVAFEQQSSVTTLNSAWFDTAGNFYVTDGGTNQVQITASGALNNASAGGLGDSGGTYGTSGITFDWDGTLYNAKDGSGANDYANVRMDALQLRDGSGNDLTVAAPSMSTNYTLTLPAAVPGSTALVQVSAAGVASYSNTVTSLITASAGVTASVNQDFTTSGTGAYNHGTYQESYGGIAGQMVDSSDNVYFAQGDYVHASRADAAGTSVWSLWVAKKVGKTVESIDLYWDPQGTVGTKTFLARSAAVSTGTTNIEGSSSPTTATSGIITLNLVTSSFPLTANEGVVITASLPQGVDIIGVDINYSE
tara:strand:+ start:16481 stop:17587 length:1107 start_codon:yes stop_codon:yes gene_type:complete